MNRHHSSAKTCLSVMGGSHSDRGRVRTHNEDALFLPPPAATVSPWGQLYLLADGAGGHAAGEVASRLVTATIASVYYQASMPMGSLQTAWSTKEYLPETRAQVISERLAQAFAAAHERLLACAAMETAYRGMASTCVAVVLWEHQAILAHVGDSRAYLIRVLPAFPPHITCLTTDHSMAMALVQAGTLPVQELRRAPSRHLLTRLLGAQGEEAAKPDTHCVALEPGDQLLLCCDGLWGAVPEDQMAQVTTQFSPQQACEALVRLANAAGGEDNVSALIISTRTGTDQACGKGVDA